MLCYEIQRHAHICTIITQKLRFYYKMREDLVVALGPGFGNLRNVGSLNCDNISAAGHLENLSSCFVQAQ